MLLTTPRFARLALGLGLLIGLVGSAPVRAIDITFDLSSGVSNLSTFSKTVSGITLTFLNPNIGPNFKGDSDGLGLGNASSFMPSTTTSFQLQVTGGTVQFKSYLITYEESTSATFSLSGGSGTSTNNPFNSTGTFTANGNWSLASGETGTLTAGPFTVGELSQLNSMTFSIVPVPEPSTYALGLVATGVLAAVARRRRATRA
jgi:hypothetical protein